SSAFLKFSNPYPFTLQAEIRQSLQETLVLIGLCFDQIQINHLATYNPYFQRWTLSKRHKLYYQVVTKESLKYH
ncbi:MAG: hypothetical protein WA460_04620, partial [Nitrososphaeraceae archaeon]